MDPVIVVSSDEEDNPTKKLTIYKSTSNAKNSIHQNVPPRLLKKVQNSTTITPIYNNNNSNSATNNNQNVNIIQRTQQLDKSSKATINSISITNNMVSIKSNLVNNNNNISGNINNNSTNNKNSINSPIKNSPISGEITIKSYRCKKRSNNNSPSPTPPPPPPTVPPSPTATTPIASNSTLAAVAAATAIRLTNSSPKTINSVKLNTINIQCVASSPVKIHLQQKPATTKVLGNSRNVQSLKINNAYPSLDAIKLPELVTLNKEPIKNIIRYSKETLRKSPTASIKRKIEYETIIPDKILETPNVVKQKLSIPPPIVKRVKPTTISNKVSDPNWKINQSPFITIDDDEECDVIELSNKNLASPKQLINLPKLTTFNYSKPSATVTSNSISNNIETETETNTTETQITKPITSLKESNENDLNNLDNSSSSSITPNGKLKDDNDIEKTPLTPAYIALLKACRDADPSSDMEKIIDKKLLKYYYSVHPDFVSSKGFRKTVESTISEITTTPQLVYMKLKTIVEELKTRRNSKEIIINNEEHKTTGNVKRDEQVRKLSRGLYKLQMLIKKSEEECVDWDCDMDSSYLKESRYKKRAYEIYEKICDLTGESKHAHRQVSKPISFQGTSYPLFNKTIQSFVNRTKMFPDYLDIFRLLEFSNKQNSLGISTDEMKIVAQDAFVKVGELLQKRRKTDLYETVTYITGDSIDPAENDSDLNAKLTENLKLRAKTSTVFEMFAKRQEAEAEEKNNFKINNRFNDDNDKNESENEMKSSTEIKNQNKLLESIIQDRETINDSSKKICNLDKTDDVNKISSNLIIANNEPSTSTFELKIKSVESLSKKKTISNNNVVCEIVVSDDDDET